MGITTDKDLDDTIRIQDATSGSIAKVSTKTTGEFGLHTISETNISSVGAGNIFSWGTNLRYYDMNVSNGGVARNTSIGTTYVTLFNRNGSGLFMGLTVSLSTFSSDWQVKMIVDSVTVFELLSADLASSTIYNLDVASAKSFNTLFGLLIVGDSFIWQGPIGYPMKYETNITLQARRTTTPNKNFQGGFVTAAGV